MGQKVEACHECNEKDHLNPMVDQSQSAFRDKAVGKSLFLHLPAALYNLRLWKKDPQDNDQPWRRACSEPEQPPPAVRREISQGTGKGRAQTVTKGKQHWGI
ncbi:hypothetical protein RBB50_010133 [Rhinocladiella similis]